VRGKYVEYDVGEGCLIRFVEVATRRHLTNYKPLFLSKLLNGDDSTAETLFYFDPDIVIKCDWNFFEEWASYGIALCEDVNSPMLTSHPIRCAWRRFCTKNGVELIRDFDVYVSGGFVGINRRHGALLSTWAKLVEAMEEYTGDLGRLGYRSRPFPFYNADQDVLNMTIMASSQPVSISGKDGMDFATGGYIMSHAAGGAKPWRKRMLAGALRGIAPSLADKHYWGNVTTPIRLYSTVSLMLHRLDLLAGAMVGLFVKRA
jgi:hypothetical protein